MGKKVPPRKLSVIVNARRASKGLAGPADNYATSIQESKDDLSPCRPATLFSQALHELQPVGVEVEETENELGLYRLQPPPGKEPLPGPIVEESEEPPKKDDTKQATEEGSKPNRGAQHRWAYKNVIGVSLSVFFIFTAFLGLQNLQSSINSSGGLGLGSLAVLYVFFTISGFISPGLLKIMGTKYSLLAAYICHLVYTLANFYPSWFTLIPASLLLGVASALLWAAASSHLVQVAIRVAPKLQKDQDHLISTFTGIFFAIFQVAQIPGNLASSLILFPYNKTVLDDFDDFDMETDPDANFTTDAGTCQHSGTGQDFDVKYLYILDSVYVLFVSMGICTLLVMVNRLDTPSTQTSASFCQKYGQFFKKSLGELFDIMKNYRMILIAPISIFNGIEQSFVFGIFTQAFIANCFGTYQVGFTLISLGITSSILSIVCGRIVKYVSRIMIFFMGGVINIALLTFLLTWTPTPSYPVIYVFAVLWGAADGVWNTMTASLTGILFPTQSETAYCAQRIWLAVGFTIVFVTAEFLPVSGSVWFALCTVPLALVSVFIIELANSRSSCWRHHSCSSVVNPDIAGLYSNSVTRDEVKGLPSIDNKEQKPV